MLFAVKLSTEDADMNYDLVYRTMFYDVSEKNIKAEILSIFKKHNLYCTPYDTKLRTKVYKLTDPNGKFNTEISDLFCLSTKADNPKYIDELMEYLINQKNTLTITVKKKPI